MPCVQMICHQILVGSGLADTTAMANRCLPMLSSFATAHATHVLPANTMFPIGPVQALKAVGVTEVILAINYRPEVSTSGLQLWNNTRWQSLPRSTSSVLVLRRCMLHTDA